MILNKQQIAESSDLMDLRETALYYLGQLDRGSTSIILTGKLGSVGEPLEKKVKKEKKTPKVKKGKNKR